MNSALSLADMENASCYCDALQCHLLPPKHPFHKGLHKLSSWWLTGEPWAVVNGCCMSYQNGDTSGLKLEFSNLCKLNRKQFRKDVQMQVDETLLVEEVSPAVGWTELEEEESEK